MEQTKNNLKVNPRNSANFFSKLTFLWTIPIFIKGSKKTIEADDLYEVLDEDKSRNLGNKLEREYMKEVLRCKRKMESLTEAHEMCHPKIGIAIFKTFWKELICTGVICFINEGVIKMISPIMLGKLLEYFSPESVMRHYEAVLYGCGVILLSGLSALAMDHYLMTTFHMGMRIRVAVCSLIYRKTLRLSHNALDEATPGKIVNLLSNDVGRFDISAAFLHYIWVSPLVAVIVLYFLWIEIGVSALLGVLVVFAVMPTQVYTGKLSAKFRLQTALKTDERVRFMGEIISGVQVIKMYAWEKPFQALITLARRSELKMIGKIYNVRAAFLTFSYTTTKIAMFLVIFSMINMEYRPTSAKIFVIATYFNILSQTISSLFVRSISEVAEGLVTLKRFEKYLEHDEFQNNSHTTATSNGNVIEADKEEKNDKSAESAALIQDEKKMEDAQDDNEMCDVAVKMNKVEAKWNLEKEHLTLNIDSLDVKRGKLVGIIGLVGSGKSSLLQALLHELPLLKGSLKLRGSVSYACQDPWVFGGTVRQNILFGLPYEKDKYTEVIRVCSLQKDFQQFPFGDKTLVGERGTSLSGGQKARINLARAVYRRADVYLLDDPLSAVDAHVGRQLFDQCIRSFLRHRTTLLVTHQLHYLKDADHIILLKDGKIEMQGTYQVLSNCCGDFTQLLLPTSLSGVKDTDLNVIEKQDQGENNEINMRKLENKDITTDLKNDSKTSSNLISNESVADEKGKAADYSQQQVAEASSKSAVPGSVGWRYLRAGLTIQRLVFLTFIFIASQVFMSAADFWMAFWTSQEELRDYFEKLYNTSSSTNFNPTVELSNQNNSSMAADTNMFVLASLMPTNTCMWIHATIVILAFVFTLIRSFGFYNFAVNASQKLHDSMFKGIIRSPMMFFHKNPSGRIINRFAKDMGTVDEMLPKAIFDAIQVLLQTAGCVVLACYINPYFLVPILIIGYVFVLSRGMYLKTSRNIKRVEGVAKSPVYTHLNATLHGMSTIRAFKAQEILTNDFDRYQDFHSSAWYMQIATSTAFGFFLDVMCLILITTVTFSFLIFSTSAMSDQVGLAITQSVSLTFVVQWGIRQSAEVSNQLMAVERILEYVLLPPESGIERNETDAEENHNLLSVKSKEITNDWPQMGEIVFKDLSMKYTDDPKETYVLVGIDCVIEPREKVGIVGRTGAGKSSIISALFRLAFNEGSVIIDGVDTRNICVNDLRKKISIIPQDPVLFSGTLRRNLDPFEEFPDSVLWQVLDEVELKDITGKDGLGSKVTDGGSNFSVGQRQLVCLARAILRNNRILMLDEATANVDPHTDSLVQKTIREKFARCTVLTVAHRLNTIMDSDRVIVMDYGKIVEFDHPFVLLKNLEGYLSKMAANTEACRQLYMKLPTNLTWHSCLATSRTYPLCTSLSHTLITSHHSSANSQTNHRTIHTTYLHKAIYIA